MIRTTYIALFIVALWGCKTQEKVAENDKKPIKQQHSKSYNESYFSELFVDASKQKILGNFQLAINLYKQCTEQKPDEPAPYYEIGRLLFENGQFSDGLSFAKMAVDLNGDNFWYRVLYAQLLHQTGDTKGAIKQYEEMLTRFPEKQELYMNLATLYQQDRDYNGVISTLNKLEERIGISEEVSMEKERAYVRLGNVEKAASEVRKLIKAYPEETRYLGVLADLYATNGFDDEAMEVYEEILQQDPNDPFVHLSLADYYKAKGENEKSYEHLVKAFKNERLEVDGKVQILLSYYQLTEVFPELKEQAFELSELLVEVHPHSAKAYTIRGDFLLREDKKEEAKEAFRLAVHYEKNKFPIWSELMLLESELNDLDSLAVHSNEAMELFPNQPLSYLMNGIANFQLKAYKKAAESLEAGKDLVVDDLALKAQFHSTLGDTYHALGEHTKSDGEYKLCLELNPDNVYVLNNYAYYLSQRKENLQKAESMSARTVKLEPKQATFLDTYGWIKFQMGKYEEALKYLLQAVELGAGNSAEVLEHVGDAYFKLNQQDKALEYWKKADKQGQGSDKLKEKIEKATWVE